MKRYQRGDAGAVMLAAMLVLAIGWWWHGGGHGFDRGGTPVIRIGTELPRRFRRRNILTWSW